MKEAAVSAILDAGTCDECRRRHMLVLKRGPAEEEFLVEPDNDEVPPFEDCTSAHGCRCTIVEYEIDTREDCPACGGYGYREEIQGYVSREMALDACEPALEGQPIPSRVTCDRCGGGGIV